MLFVNGSVPCSDTTSDSSVTPFCHVGPAVGRVAPGQTVQIAAGVYAEPPVDVAVQGTAAAPVVITAAPGAHVQIGDESQFAKTGVVFDHASYVTLNGVSVYGSNSDSAIAVDSSSHVGLTGVVADVGLRAAVHVNASDSTLVARSWLSDQSGPSTDNGIVVDGGSTATTITADASAAALRAVWIDGATGTVVTGTTSQYACVAGIEVDQGSTGTVAENNIVSNDDAVVAGTDSVAACGTATPDPNHGDIAVAADSLAGSHFDFNLLDSSLSPGSTTYRWGAQTFTTAADFHTSTGQGARDIVAPAGLSTYDVPLEGSAAVDSADSDAGGEQSTDLAGHPRVADPTLKQTGGGARDYDDRGAFELQDPFAASLTWTPAGTFTAAITAATTGWHPATSYTFDFGNGDVVTQSSPTISRAFPIKPQPGNQQFQVKVTATEAGTGTAASSSEVVGFLYAPPVVHLVTSAPLAADMKSYTLTADASSSVVGTEPIKSYTFHVIRTDTPSRPFDMTVTQASPVYTLPDALEGLYSVTVTATDALGVAGTTQEPQSVLQDVGVRPVGAVTVQRVAGADRYLTAVAVSQQIWANASTGSADSTGRKTANAVVLATGGGFADAVAGVPLAAKTSGPLLLTAPSSLTPETAAEITRVLPAHQNKTVYVLGGTNAISEPVAAKIRALGYTVVRFGDTDRFATALDIAEQEFPNAGHVFVATGRTFPDALAAGPLAATQNAPILLSDGPELDAATASYLRRQAASAPAGSASVTAVGGDADRALTTVDGGALPHEGLVGSDRYATAAAVAAAFPQQVHTTHVGIATGEQFADALTGGAMMAALGQPLLLTTSSNLSSVDYTALYGWMELRTVSVFGGPIAVSDGTVSQIINQVRGSAG